MFYRMIFYGFSKKAYLSVKSQCDKSNMRHAEIVSTLFLTVMVFAVIMSMVGLVPSSQRMLYITFALITGSFEAVIVIFKKFLIKYNRIVIYLAMLILTSFATLFGKEEPFLISAVFPVYMFIGGVAFIDNMHRFTMFIILETVGFTMATRVIKPASIARYDLIYAIIFAVTTLLFHYRFQRGRMEQFLLYEKTLEAQQNLEVQSSFDALSGLLVRGRFFSLADSILRGLDGEEYVALCILDLDCFKQINDRYGHQLGDKAIQMTAEIIWAELGADLSRRWEFCEHAVREKESFAGRLGGDEFVIFFRTIGKWEEVEKKLRHILDCLNAVELGDLKGIHASFGVTEITGTDKDIDTVYARADKALYEAKTKGKNCIVKG